MVLIFSVNGYMKLKKLTKVFVIFTILVTFSQDLYGIANYKAIPLDNLLNDILEQGTIAFEYRIFNREDCKKYLGRDKIIDKGYQPIQINFTNNSDRCLVMSETNFSFPCVYYYDVAKQVHFDTTKRVLAWGILGQFRGLISIPFLALAIIEAIKSPRANEKLFINYSEKTLNDQIIRPRSAINGLIFVASKCFKPEFSFALIDLLNGKQLTLSTTNRQLKI